MEFKNYLIESEQSDVQKTLSKIPKKHRQLVRGYKFIFQPGNTLKNDNDSIGELDEEGKKITVCAPWNYGRQFTMLHEIGHLIWKYILNDNHKKQWKELYRKASPKQNQGMEELFCMAYAATYCKNPPEIHNHKTWTNFIRNLK